jgi:2-dehydropantoate 2-reductase
MRILVVGAGAVGGYFGGRLLEANQDVTFLVRPRRAAELASLGLIVRSRFGDVTISQPPTILAENLREPFDLVLLSCKAYDLEGAIESFAPAVGPNTAILPLLNGMKHMDRLDERFGPSRVLGGQCLIAAALKPDGQIVHLNDAHFLSFGERDGSHTARITAIAAAFAPARFDSRLSETIMQEMWEKWIFIATGAGITCLMRAAIGDIVAAGASALVIKLLDECAEIATLQGFPPRASSIERARTTFTATGSPLTASMFRDIEQGARIEADHVIGDLLRRGDQEPGSHPILRIVYAHLKAYEARRERERTGKAASSPQGQAVS